MADSSKGETENTGLTTVFFSWCEQVLKSELFQSSTDVTDVVDTEEYKESVESQILMLNEC